MLIDGYISIVTHSRNEPFNYIYCPLPCRAFKIHNHSYIFIITMALYDTRLSQISYSMAYKHFLIIVKKIHNHTDKNPFQENKEASSSSYNYVLCVPSQPCLHGMAWPYFYATQLSEDVSLRGTNAIQSIMRMGQADIELIFRYTPCGCTQLYSYSTYRLEWSENLHCVDGVRKNCLQKNLIRMPTRQTG